jgi:hypothetical protein
MLKRHAIACFSIVVLASCGDSQGSGDTAADTTDPDGAEVSDTSESPDSIDTTDVIDTTDAPDTQDTQDTTDALDTRDTTDTPDIVPPNSCVGRCGAAFDPLQACQCDAECLPSGNCCPDYEVLCELPCEDPSLTRCGDTCVDTDTSTDFCGSCETPCDDKGNQAVSCAGGECTRACLPGFVDCNLDPGDGCEAELARDPEHCGSCEKSCDSGPFGAPACRGGQCTLACNPGRGACNDLAFDGCETDLTSNEDSCGYCGVSCPTFPNTAPLCAASGCATTCLEGFEDCDDVPTNGCEADLQHAATTCGACDNACGPAETCVQGGCACTGAFQYVFPPTARIASAMAEDRFSFALSCNLAETSIDDPAFAVIGTQGGAVAGTLARAGGNGLDWSSATPLIAGEEVDITIGAGFRSFDSLKSSAYRVIKARVAASSAGSGTFIAGQTVNPGIYLGQVVLGDFDGDGDLDMVTDAYNATTQIKGSIHLNDGVELGATIGDPKQANFQRLAVHDFNRDGRADLVVMNNAAGGFGATKVLWGAAQSPLAAGTNLTTIGGQMSPAIGDIDGDGDLDLVISRRPGANGDQAGVRFTYDANTGTFASLGAISANAADGYAAALIDVDDDGDLDLFQANGGLADRVYTNSGTGTFTAGTTYGTTTSEPSGVEVGDLNGDGFPDVLVVNRTVADKIYLGSATGAFTEVNAPSLSGVDGALGGQVRLADIDGDGDLDIVGITSGKLAIYRNDGSGTFSGGGTTFDSIGFAVGDLDGDGDLDIANIANASAGVTILKNACSGASCTCGNGALNGKEACDDGPAGSSFCDPDCTLRRCGDGFVNALGGEQCDDGNDIDDDGCRDSCVLATCTDGRANHGETDVDCGGPCGTKCAAQNACLGNEDCQSGICAGFVCAYKADFEGGLPDEFSTGPTNPWVTDATTPISNSALSLISHDFTVQGTGSSSAGTSSVFLTATIGAGGGRLVYDVQTNCSYASVLSLRIDGVKVIELYGRRLQLDNGYTDSYDLPAGTHTFEWRYESKIGTAQGLPYPPYHRAWIDNVVLINGAP